LINAFHYFQKGNTMCLKFFLPTALLVSVSLGLIPSSASAGISIQTPVEKHSTGYALLIGVSRVFDEQSDTFAFVDNEMQELAEVLVEGGFSADQVIVMDCHSNDAQLRPTAANIRKQLDKVAKASADVVMVAFSGNVFPESYGDGDHIVTMDSSLVDKTPFVAEAEVLEALAKCKAELRLAFWDADRSQSKQIQVPPSVHAFYCCQVGEKSWSDEKLGSGRFYYYLIHGLRGAADFDHDGRITLSEIESFTTTQVSQFWLSDLSTQRPVRISSIPAHQPILALPWMRKVPFSSARVATRDIDQTADRKPGDIPNASQDK
jgi:hypothetical protein